LAIPPHAANRNESEHSSPLSSLPAKISSFGLVEVRPKQVGIAVLLALLFGPLGLVYFTMIGTTVMLIVSFTLTHFLGKVSFLIIQPIRAIWAWRAARSRHPLSTESGLTHSLQD
jgi:hypothetical protein